MTKKLKIVLGLAVLGAGSAGAMRFPTAVSAEEVPTAPATISSTTNAKTPGSSADVMLARNAESRGAWEAAGLHLGRAIQADPTDREAMKLIPEITSKLVERATEDGLFTEARVYLEVATSEIEAAKSKRFDSSLPAASLQDVVDAERRVAEIRAGLTEAGDAACRDWISAADQCAADAHWHWYTLQTNDRNKVREGLRELHKVHDLFDVIDDDTRGEYYRALQRLKDVVTDKEWPSLMASAGFEKAAPSPVSD